ALPRAHDRLAALHPLGALPGHAQARALPRVLRLARSARRARLVVLLDALLAPGQEPRRAPRDAQRAQSRRWTRLRRRPAEGAWPLRRARVLEGSCEARFQRSRRALRGSHWTERRRRVQKALRARGHP